MNSLKNKTVDLAFPDFLPFARPTISEEAITEVVDCLRSGWITTGPRVAQFEAALKNYLQTDHLLAVSSATTGLYLVIQALEFEPGDEIITTPMTFAATLNVIELNNLKPVLVDVDPFTYNMNVAAIEAAITPRTRAIMPVHFAGLPVDLAPLYALAGKHDLRVIEDAAHAIGASYGGQKIGSFGDIQVFSFHPNKNMTTGEGGCISLRDEKLAAKIALLRFHGMDREAWNRFGKSGNQHYEIIAPGHKANMMDIQAALGCHQLPALDGYIETRTQLVSRYQDRLSTCAKLTLPQSPLYDHQHAWHLFAPLINTSACGLTRDDFVQALKERNVGTGVHYRAAHLYPYYREKYGWTEDSFPHATHIGDHILSLPLFPLLTTSEQGMVIDIILQILAD